METPLVWAEIDLQAVAHNTRCLKRASGVHLMAVVKADAYGHGAIEVARCALAHGADRLGVARVDEGLQLRRAGFQAPILVFGHTPAERAGDLIDNGLTATVYSLENAAALARAATAAGRRLAVHVKVDSGMGRLGLVPDARRQVDPGKDARTGARETVAAIAGLEGLEMEGIFTHFADADSPDPAYTRRQYRVFCEFLDDLHRAGSRIPVRHAANSAAIIAHPETHLDMVRAGIALYGLRPSADIALKGMDLRPAMALKARVVHLKRVPAGFAVSYGMTWRAPAPTVVASVALGYADGYSRRLSSRGVMLVRGRRAAVIGRVCMDTTMLDVGHIPGVAVGDEVVVFGRQGEAEIPADELAATLETINYEIVTSITARVPRIYLPVDRS